MNQRFYVYPLFFTVALQVVPLLRSRWRRWYALQIMPLLLILLAGCAAAYFDEDFAWVIFAWSLFLVFVVAPRLTQRLATHALWLGRSGSAARWWRVTGWLVMPPWGRLHRSFAASLELWSAGDRQSAEALLEVAAGCQMPENVQGELQLWKLMLLTTSREWAPAAAFYESTYGWGTLGTAMEARLLVARAYAELGQTDRALRCLQFVALSPRTIGALERQFWMARVCVAALAGDAAEVESLVRHRSGRGRGLARFTAYWRGRCALVRGDRAVAGRELSRALALTPHRLPQWRAVTAGYVREAELGVPVPAAELTETYRHGQEVLRLAEQQAAGWQALMHWGRPAAATLVLLLVITVVFVADQMVFVGVLNQPLWEWAGNVPVAVRHGEWWRAVTALFLHANVLHWAMNGAALWMFGSAVEKTGGWWRFLTVFLVAGTLANLVSAWTARYDVSVGASGGIFGVIGAFVVAVQQLKSPVYAAVRRRLLVMLAVMIAADFTIGGLEPQVDNLAHGGGFAFGVGLAWLLRCRAAPCL